MMEKRGININRKPFIFLSVLIICVSLVFSSIKLEVIANNAHIKIKPEIGGENIAQVNAGTILIGEEKRGEWYKVNFEKEGQKITGFIHEMLVKVVDEGESQSRYLETSLAKELTQEEITAEINAQIENSKKSIREEQNLGKAIEALRPLIPKVFHVSDLHTQKKLATEIYLWIGLGYAAQNKEFLALREIKNMFQVNHSYALEISRNIYDPDIAKIINLAEKEYLGLIEQYYLKISTNPQDAILKINGNEVGKTPKTIKSDSPKFFIEINKKGYETIAEEIFLVAETSEKEFILQKKGRSINIKSIPSEAKIHLDGKIIEKKTNTTLPFVEFGNHKIKIEKKGYKEWNQEFELEEGEGPLEIQVTLEAKEYIKVDQWGGKDTKFFEAPTGITIDKQNNFYIIDESNLKIKKFNPEGVFMSELAKNKRELNRLKSPFAITMDHEEYIYVTDIKKHCVMKFDKMGNFVLSWGKEGSEEDDFNTPLGIAVDSQNNIYVADSVNHKVKKFSHLGIFINSWGNKGTSDGSFMYPAGIFINDKDEVFVTDQNNLQKFTSNGEFILSWGHKGTAPGEFDRPMGIYVDNKNCIYISDTYNNRIQKFDKSGLFITKWGSKGSQDNQLNFPLGIVVDSQSLVYVVERDNNRIQIFSTLSE